MQDLYVFAYLDSRMVGKPTYISAASDAQGFYRLYLGTGGTYYLGARSTFGGPLEPGSGSAPSMLASTTVLKSKRI